MPYTLRSGVRIFFELRGDRGQTLVLIRGLGRSGSYWGPIVPLLADRLRLLVIDNRGVGRSDAPRGPYATFELADDVAHVMDAAGIDRAHVFGMSLGGMIAQEVALRHGARVDRLVLGCTTPGGPKARKTERRARLVMLAAALGWRTHLFPLLVSDASLRARPEIREEWLRLARVEPLRLRGFLGQAAAAQNHDAFDRLARIDRPTLVVTGDDDAIIPHENSRLLADAIPGATLRILPGARHDFTTDQPDASARAILEFLAP